MPIIRNVSWTAENMPDGVTIDKDTGIISGTPANYGSFSVPVTVKTDYGSDTKDVGIIVKGNYSILIKGTNAITWGADGENTPDGLFRIISIGKGLRLDSFRNGFGVKMVNGDYYVCGDYDLDMDYKNPQQKLASSPINLGSDIEQMTGLSQGVLPSSKTSTTGTVTFDYAITRYSDGRAKICAHSNGINSYGVPGTLNVKNLFYIQGCAALQGSPYGNTGMWVMQDGTAGFLRTAMDGSVIGTLTTEAIEGINIVDNKIYSNAAQSAIQAYFRGYDDNGDIYYYSGSVNANDVFTLNTPTASSLGVLKDFWFADIGNVRRRFYLYENNMLYATGDCWRGCLGLPSGSPAYYTNKLVGEFDVKKIVFTSRSTFLLANDGKLYYAGQAMSALGLNVQYEEFTHVFTDYRFSDVAYTGSTLIAIQES